MEVYNFSIPNLSAITEDKIHSNCFHTQIMLHYKSTQRCNDNKNLFGKIWMLNKLQMKQLRLIEGYSKPKVR